MNVLIVDDQVDVVRGIVTGVDWQAAGAHLVYQAYSAREAKEILDTRSVHVLLCDIEMPEKSGLDLYRWVRGAYPEVECIFLSAHAEFAYAREALELGSFAYILQPAPYEEIGREVARAIEAVRQKSRDRQDMAYGAYWKEKKDTLLDSCVRSFLSGTGEDADQLLADLASLGHPLDHSSLLRPGLVQVVRRTGDGSRTGEIVRRFSPPRKGGPTIVARLDKWNYIALAPVAAGEESSESDLQNLAGFTDALHEVGSDIACYVGPPVKVTGLVDVVSQLLRLRKENVAGYCRVFTLEGDLPAQKYAALEADPPADSYPDMAYWGKLLVNGGAGKVRERAHQYLEERKHRGTLNSEILARFHQDFVQMLLGLVREMGDDARVELFGTEFDAYLQAYTSLSDMHQFIDHAMDFFQRNAVPAGSELPPVTRAVEYINQNIEKNLGRAEIAEAVYLNPEYLSRLFKKEMGVSLVDFIVNRKMEIAESLLVNTAIPIYLVASKVGYSNFSYFSKVFKKHSGSTPQEFRGGGDSRPHS